MAPMRVIQLFSPLSHSMSIARVIMQKGLGSLKLSSMGRLMALKKAAGERKLMVVTACR